MKIGYARVSTDHDEQQTSYEAQLDYYTNFIRSHSEWEFVGMYSDEGVTGTSTKRREGFQNMVADALNGKIDLILTKSVSRFARNTVDSLTTIRELKANGVEVYFEKENIWTFDSKGELLITLMSSLAQEESRSISENVKWGRRKSFADGKVSMSYSAFLGYRRGTDGKPEIDPEQAEIVRRIYRMFVEGKAPNKIADILTKEGVPTPAGKKVWQRHVVESILTNEKYKGDALLQKSFTTDFLTKSHKKNEGEVPQYYVEGSHPAIIDPGAWEAVQREMTRRKKDERYRYCNNVFAGKIICGDCGNPFGSKIWHSNDKYRKVIWRCNGKYEKKTMCQTPHLSEEEIRKAFVKAVSKLISDRERLIEDGRVLMAELCDCSKIEKKLDETSAEKEKVLEQLEKLISENKVKIQDQDEYDRKYAELEARYAELETKMERLEQSRTERELKADALGSFIFELGEMEDLDMEFSERCWNAVVDAAIVDRDWGITFKFNNGQEVWVEGKK